ncbi:MAG: DNA translocase FtsK [Salinivirgaceae bacterium]|nr:DNA translocase FtsK [Salinivirgaceae bacterium]
MAKKKSSFANDEDNQNTSDRRRIIVGLCVASLTVYLAFAFISYLFTWQIDQSTLDIPANKLFFNSNIVASNWSGTLGALLAQRFMYRWFGLPSFSLILILSVIALKLLKIKSLPIGKIIKLSILYTVWLSVALSYVFHHSAFAPGGAHGYFISEWMNSVLGKLGTGIVLVTLLFVFLSFTFDSFINRCKTFVKSLFTSKLDDSELTTDQTDEEGNEVGYAAIQNSESDEASEDEDDSESDATEQPSDDEVPIDVSFANLDNDSSVEADNKFGVKSEDSDDNNSYFHVTYATNDNEEDIAGQQEIDKPEDGLNDDVKLNITQNEEEQQVDNPTDIEKMGPYDPTRDLENYRLPSIDLLNDYEKNNTTVSNEELNANKDKIVETLNEYKVEIETINATVGPTVTLYEIVPAKGYRISKIKSLGEDIALRLAALGIRIIAPIPGRGTIGIEVPNAKPQTVSMRAVLASPKFQEAKYELPVAIGKTITNETFTFDLTKTPHLLVAGATGQGKSVGLNAILTSLLYKKHPAQLKLVLVDPKKVELTLYKALEKYFLAKLPDADNAIITDTQKVVNTLQSLCIEMDSRYDLLQKAQCRNIKEYNEKFMNRRLNPENGHHFLPYIVVVIDEFADLIMTAGREVETPIARIAQLARAIGIHLIIATQRPTTNVITGLIKANFPARIAFRVMSLIDSRTILDAKGADQLIGRGDMLIAMGGGETTRVQCAFVDTDELERIMEHISQQQSYTGAYELPEYVPEGGDGANLEDVDLSKRDLMFEDAARAIVISQQGSTSLIQRKFAIGYNRAGRIMDQLEAAGIVGPYQGSKAREVLIPDEMSLDRLLETLR